MDRKFKDPAHRSARRSFVQTVAGAAAMGPLAGVGALLAPAASWASTYPDKPVKIVVPFATGGATDILGRLMARAMEPLLKQTVIVDNRAGAAGAIGGAAVAKSDPDGYTVLFGGLGTNVVLNMTQPGMAYDAEKDLAPVCYLCNIDYVMVVAANSPYKTLADLIDAAKNKPSTLSYMSTGPSGPIHVAMEYLCKLANVKMIHVPYKGEAPALTDLLSGRIDVAVMTVPFTKPLVQDNRIRPLATISGQRPSGMPEVKTVAEQGYAGYDVLIWNGLFVPMKTPAPIIETLNRAAMAALKDSGTQQRMLELGVSPTGSTPGEYTAMLVKERERWSKMIRETGVANS